MRVLKVLAIGMVALGSMEAGPVLGELQFEIGGASGLNDAYVTGNCGGACITGSVAGSSSEVNYNNVVFSGATGASGPPSAYTGYSTTVPSSGNTMKDTADSVTFAMIGNDTTGGTTDNAWLIPSNSSSSITIPVGIFGVTDVWSMLNDDLGAAGTPRDTNIILTFGSTANATTGLTTVTIKPNNTNSPYNAAAANWVQDSVVCQTGCSAGTGSGSNNGAVGPPLTSGTPTISSAGVGGTGLTTATAYTDNLYTYAYTSATGAEANTTGNVVLNDFGVVFSGNLLNFAQSNYLVSVTYMDPSAVSNSGLYVSALTVDAAPEPSTVLLLLGGFGVIGFGYFRRRRRA